MISVDENVFVVTRRLFDKDVRRHFIGKVVRASPMGICVEGYVFTYDESVQEFTRLDELRTRLLAFADSGIIILILQPDIDLKNLKYYLSPQSKRFLTDGKNFMMNVVEFGTHR